MNTFQKMKITNKDNSYVIQEIVRRAIHIILLLSCHAVTHGRHQGIDEQSHSHKMKLYMKVCILIVLVEMDIIQKSHTLDTVKALTAPWNLP